MGQIPQEPPHVGQVVNGYQWNGTQWVALPPPPQVGQVVNGHQWNGTRWIPLPAPTGAPQADAALVAELRRFAEAWQFGVTPSANGLALQRVVAERKAFLSTARLEYLAKVTIDTGRREVRFTEMLKESGAGLTSGGGDDGDFGTQPGFGFQKTSYNTRTDGIAESIEEQARNFATKYAPGFRFEEVREQVKRIAEATGYTFVYGLL